jgi:predicted AlkP superfamily phosphohydrolase/phosphomutase
MSDHGFAPYYRGFNVNSWLVEEGYLVLTDPSKRGHTDSFKNINWKKTKAYGLGLNGIFINVKGREKYGSVDPMLRRPLVDEISAKLLDVVDEKYGKNVVSHVYVLEDAYHGPFADPMAGLGPDIQIGYNWGYRASWETGLGETPEEIIVDNKNKWSGDHCIDHTLVPGILMSNRTIEDASPTLSSLSRVILAELGMTDIPGFGEIEGLGEGVDIFDDIYTGGGESTESLKSIGYMGGGGAKEEEEQDQGDE